MKTSKYGGMPLRALDYGTLVLKRTSTKPQVNTR